MIDLAYESSTNKKYDPLVSAFEDSYGSLLSITPDRLVDCVLSFASGFVIDGRLSQAHVAIAALARTASLRLNRKIYDDARVKAFNKGLA